MDSLTQAALGAAVGEAVLGRKIGWKAPVWGAAVGTIPDLDVLVNPFVSELAQLSVHRGFSHSIVFTLLAAPLIGWGLNKLHKEQASFRQWSLFAWLCLISAIMLDAFTVYGTQLLLPFSNYRVGFNTISIIDPLYTVPLLFGVAIAMFFRRQSEARKWLNLFGLGLSTLYLLTTIGIKSHINGVFERALDDQQLQYSRYMTSPTLFNAVLWHAVAENDSGYYTGYYSLFDPDQHVAFQFVPRNDSLLAPVDAARAVEKLKWFSNGYYTAMVEAGRLKFSDLRFGRIETGDSLTTRFIFTWNLEPDPTESDGLVLSRPEPSIEDPKGVLSGLWNRIKGIRD